MKTYFSSGIYHFASNFYRFFSQQIESIICYVLKKFFFFDQSLPPDAHIRRNALKNRGAIQLDLNIDGFLLKSKKKKKTRNVILIALHKPYEKYLPKNYEIYLKNGADVILWNPIDWTPKQYETDLQKVLRKILDLESRKKIAIIARCATVDPTISLTSRLQNPNISLILDRGHGDAKKLARSFSVFSKLPIVQKVIDKHFSCKGMEKIHDIPGNILFITTKNPDRDQVMSYGAGKNLTRDLIKQRKISSKEDEVVFLKKSDHWTPWKIETHQKIHAFLQKNGILSTVEKFEDQNPLEPKLYAKKILPCLIKSCF